MRGRNGSERKGLRKKTSSQEKGGGWEGVYAMHNLGRVLRPCVDARAVTVAAMDHLYSMVRYRHHVSRVRGPQCKTRGPRNTKETDCIGAAAPLTYIAKLDINELAAREQPLAEPLNLPKI